MPVQSENDWEKIQKNMKENLADDPIAVDELYCWCHVSANIMRSVSFELELLGYLQHHSATEYPERLKHIRHLNKLTKIECLPLLEAVSGKDYHK